MIAAVVFISFFSRKQTDRFTILGISSNRPYKEDDSIRALLPEESVELTLALSQPYSYFRRGAQTYVFLSADGNYVVKFFEQRIYKRSKLLNLVPLPKFLHRYRDKRNFKRDDKLKRDFFSYKTAFEKLQHLSGLLYVHLHRTDDLNIALEMTDSIGIKHTVELDKFDFIVQKRADTVHGRINRLIESGEIEKAKEAIASVFSLISERAKMGLRDRDPDIATNCGFLKDKAIKIDVGRFVLCEEMKTSTGHNNELLKITAPFGDWIEEKHPTLAPYFYEKRREAML